jgi:urocanate hydratase
MAFNVLRYRFRPTYEMRARNIEEYPGRCKQAKAIMIMIQNNLDPRVAQHPHELITYGGNGAVRSRPSSCAASARIDYVWGEWGGESY